MPFSIFDFFRPKVPSVLAPGLNLEKIPKDKQSLGLEKEIYKKFRKDINTAIAEFNKNDSTEANIIALAKMEEAIHYVNSISTPAHLALAEEFHKLKASLFTKIIQAKQANALSLSKVNTDPSIDCILADMHPEKADKLMEILHRDNIGNDVELGNLLLDLYKDETGLEVDKWKKFLSNYSIEFLGGGNSKNYKVTNL